MVKGIYYNSRMGFNLPEGVAWVFANLSVTETNIQQQDRNHREVEIILSENLH